ncbi:MAG: hypothetical protein A3K90_09155 [Pelodictyon luteolum]|uniref:Uncharacterized protein n=1 Tax=Pelodictyon luteolum TaxID=1100 RepID=A0A165LZ73_PELLU|nr:hypothetical protein [Pelodictyon luteolum]KZK74612.1 MAG: hypothetical protein A3K90_09155 [Pelodictyon luteolum]
MDITYILIDDGNALHRSLSICRSGALNSVQLEDSSYRVYESIPIDFHDYAAMFHYGLPEALRELPFISESGNGFDSWDEVFLHCSSLPAMLKIILEVRERIDPENPETILLGWQEEPPAAYLRDIYPKRFLLFLDRMEGFVRRVEREGKDLEFIL